MKSPARRHPEEEEGLNIIICVVVVSTQLIKVSAKGSCSTVSRVLFLLPGFGGWAERVQVLEKDTRGSVVLLSSLQCHLSQGLKLVHFRNSMLKEWSTLCSPICYFSSFLGFPLCSLFKFRVLILPPRPSTRYIPPSHLQTIWFIFPRTEDLQNCPKPGFFCHHQSIKCSFSSARCLWGSNTCLDAENSHKPNSSCAFLALAISTSQTLPILMRRDPPRKKGWVSK